MNKRQENMLSMYEAVLAVLKTYDADIKTIPAMETIVTRFANIIAMIQQKNSEKRTVTAGKTGLKTDARKALINAILPLTNGLKALAVTRQDAELKARAKLTKSSLDRLRDTELAGIGQDIYQLATQYQADLAGFLITAQQVQDLQTRVNDYRTALSGREGAAAQRVSATSTLEELFKEAIIILGEELDTMVALFTKRNPEFVKTYKAARVTRRLGVRHKTAADETGTV